MRRCVDYEWNVRLAPWAGERTTLECRISLAILIMGLGVTLAAAAHLAINVAECRAREAYEELVGEETAANPPDDVWKGIRPLTGSWGCVVTALELVRGIGVVVAVGAGLYLLAGQ
jgi:hypothetical protein